jgi:hypothetical protein
MIRLDRESGEGVVLYLGQSQGAPFVGFNLGMSGYENRPGSLIRERRFYRPTVHLGRLFTEGRGRTFSFALSLPAALVDAWRFRGGGSE